MFKFRSLCRQRLRIAAASFAEVASATEAESAVRGNESFFDYTDVEEIWKTKSSSSAVYTD